MGNAHGLGRSTRLAWRIAGSQTESDFTAGTWRAPRKALTTGGTEEHRGAAYLARRLRCASLRADFFFGALATTRSYDRRMRPSSSLAGRTLELASITHL